MARMLISASRRTDIPAFYSEWFFNRLSEGYSLARNPMNPSQVSKIPLTPDVTDGIIFWTKNPTPMLSRLNELCNFEYAFQFTITPYDTDVEPHIPDKHKVIIPAFKQLSNLIGAERISWRYDPVFLSERYNFAYHIRAFTQLCAELQGYVRRVTISFMVVYRSITHNIAMLQAHNDRNEQMRLAAEFLKIAQSHGLELYACCDSDVLAIGISHASCIDGTVFGLNIPRDKNQRDGCNCSASADIGEYATCLHGCRYCYANHSDAAVAAKSAAHNVNSPLLTGVLRDGDTVKERNAISYRTSQSEL
ncbi:MAG: DUF1848 domain-containing protein [Oscillospiraceae bacterium]|jgi:hypothetical protein|nr:DUF1848 domain-containing protein [Oscillospiraceae bacterium]